jgi:cell division protein FtsI/penicillin-binding protein 2
MSRDRIRRIALVFGLAALVLIGWLFRLQVTQHDFWLERSYRNRWAFKDVPTRRGDIADRNGVPLAFDAPGFDLELTYRTFRRQHPVGLAMHASSLADQGRTGISALRYTDRDAPAKALDALLALPVRWLRDGTAWPRAAELPGYGIEERPGEAVARDVRIQAVAAVAALSGASRSRLASAVLRAVQDPESDGSIFEVACAAAAGDPLLRGLDGDPTSVRAALDAALAERVRDLRALDDRLLVRTGASADASLFARLDEAFVDHAVWRQLSERSGDEAEVLTRSGFWRFLGEQGRTWGTWQEWASWPAAERAELIALYHEERVERAEARAAERSGIDSYFDPLRGGDGDEPLFAPLPEGLDLPRFRDEERPFRVRARIPHDVAVWVALLEERHPGLSLRPAVRREHGALPGRDDLASLAGLVGSVGLYSPVGRSPEYDAVRLIAGEDEFARLEVDFPEEFEGVVRQSAANAMRWHLAVFGRLGRTGIEAALDDVLSGRPGLRFVEQDKRARETRMFDRLDVSPGRDVTSTVDVRLQRLAEEALGLPGPDSERALALLDPETGDILALVGRRHRLTGPGRPAEEGWTIGAMPVAWSPYVGSVAKPLVALEYLRAVREGGPDAAASLIDPSDFPACEGTWQPAEEIPYRGRPQYCGAAGERHYHGADARSTADAIAESCNIYFFEAASRLGPDGLLRAYAQFGWHPGSGISGVASEAYQDRLDGMIRLYGGGPHVEVDSAFPVPKKGIGYGLAVWPVFVARAYAGIATGALPRLRVVRDVPAVATRMPYTDEELAVVREGLARCVRSGTARRQLSGFADRLRASHGVVLVGKTGTAEVLSAARDPRGEGLNNAWFAGYVADAERPRLAFAAVVYRTEDSGGLAAAPLIQRLLDGIAADPALAAEYLRGERP